MRRGPTLAVLAVAFFVVMPAAGRAQWLGLPPGGAFYLGGEAGWTRLADEAVKGTVPVIGVRHDGVTWHRGFAIGVRGGYEWGPWQIEEEFRYQSDDGHKLMNSAAHGEYAAAAFLSNVIYSFPPVWRLAPHIGVGVGAVHLNSTLDVGGLGRVITGDDWVFGYQAIGGLRYEIGPRVSLDLDYRYLATSPARFRTGANFVDSGVPAPHLPVAIGYDTHSLVMSLNLRFGGPP